jgi:DeoR/GlpR family transcriptional regulator of sugar metabolism
VTVSELSQRFGTSEVTIRRDLQEMAASGQLIRAHRGALLAATPAPPEPPVVQRLGLEKSVKEQIAIAAAALVGDGESIFIGSGSTTLYLAQRLKDRKNLTVVTNSIAIAHELSSTDDAITVAVTGGVLRKAELSLLGYLAEMTLPELRVEKVFMGVQAINLENGWTTDHMPEVMTTRRICDMSKELIILADHSKLGTTAAAYLAPVSRLTTLVTDTQADPDFVREVEKLGVRVLLAGSC